MNAGARLTLLTRIGFATRGLLYIVIAALVLRTGRTESPSGALEYLGEGGGRVLLGVMAAGLIAYGIWRLFDAAFDLERHDADRSGAMERLGAAASGVAHLALAWQAVRLIQGVRSGGDGAREGARAALELPGGGTLVMVAGAILCVIGVFQLIKAAKGTYLRHLAPQVARQRWARWSGRAGYGARGVVFLIVGFFFVRAGLDERASGVGGTAQALSWLTSPLDLIVAVGLLCFGMFSLIEARYRVLHDVPVDRLANRATGGRF